MSKVVLAWVAVSAALGLWSLHLLRQAQDRQATITELQAKVASLEQQRRHNEAQTAVSFGPFTAPAGDSGNKVAPAEKNQSNKTVTFKDQPGAAVAVPAPQIPSREERMRMVREGHERQRQLMQDPEYREALRMQARNNFARTYPGVAEELDLDPRQTDEFFGMLSDQQMRLTEELEPMGNMDGANDPNALQEQQRNIQQRALQLQRKSEAEIAARFGQDKLQAWKDYQSTLGVRHQLESMRSTLAGRGLALSDGSRKSMIKAMAEVQRAEADEYSAAAGRGAVPQVANVAMMGNSFLQGQAELQLEATKKRNQRMLDAISPYLTYEQREVIEKEQQMQLKLQEAHLRIMRTQSGVNSGRLAPIGADGQSVEPQSMFMRKQ